MTCSGALQMAGKRYAPNIQLFPPFTRRLTTITNSQIDTEKMVWKLTSLSLKLSTKNEYGRETIGKR